MISTLKSSNRPKEFRTFAVDFDGVIHAYSKGWNGGHIYDEPIPGALPSLALLLSIAPTFIHTARDPQSVARWIEERSGYNIECTTRLPRTWYGRRKELWDTRDLLLVTDRKYPAAVYIDDRAYHFTSWDQTLADVVKK